MFFSLKHQSSFDSLPPLLLSTVPFDRVYSFKYLELILSCNLSWSSHNNSVIKRAKRLVSLIYCQFYSLPLPRLFCPSILPLFALFLSMGLPSGTLPQSLFHLQLNPFSTLPLKWFGNLGLPHMLTSSLLLI